MNNGLEMIAQQGNQLDNKSSIHFTPSISNKTNHYYNHFFNSKNNSNNDPSSIIRNIKFNNYSSPKYKNRMKFKNKLITNHYSIKNNNIQSINDDKKVASINLFKKPIITEPSCGLDKFLPNKTSEKHKTLVIDLDETLVHSYFDINPPRKADISFEITIDKKILKVSTLVRPGAIEFLEKMSEIFEIVIFTASLRIYALPIINFIDKKNKCEFKLFREHCSMLNNGFIKDLKKLSRDLNNLIILDNNPKCYYLNKENGIPIKTWIDDLSDKELYKIIPYLEFLSNENIKDIRPIVNKIKEGNKINYYKFDLIIKKYKKKQTDKNDINLINNNYKIINEENIEENNINVNKHNDNIVQNEEINKENINKLNIAQYNDKSNYNNEINKIENKEEFKSLNIEKNNNNIKEIFKNKMKSSKGNSINISQTKSKKENYIQNIILNNNEFHQKMGLNQINSQPKNAINSSISHFNKEISNKKSEYVNKDNLSIINKNHSKDKIGKTDLLPLLDTKNILKQKIKSLKYSSNFKDGLKNDDLCYQQKILCNEYKYKKNNLMPLINNFYPIKINSQKENDIFFHTLRNYKKINNIFFDYYYNNNKDNKYTIPLNGNENNYSSPINKKFLLTKTNFNRSYSEKNKFLNNYNSNNNIYFNEIKNVYQENFKDNNNMDINRSLSSSRIEEKINKKICTNNLNNRCFSSTNHYILKNNSNEYKNISNNHILNNVKKHLNLVNKTRNLSSKIKKFLINSNNLIKNAQKDDYEHKINKKDVSHPINENEKYNGSKDETKLSFLKISTFNWKKVIK